MKISVVMILICLILMAISILNTDEVPVAPNAINIPIAEINKTEGFVFPSDYSYSGGPPYKTVEGMTFESIPANTLCALKRHGTFSCAWETPDAEFPYTRANVSVDLPETEGVWSWKYDKQNLRFLPIMEPWWFYNIQHLIFSVLLTLISAICLVETIIDYLKKREQERFLKSY